MIEVGKCYYFMVHAYHHYLGEVVAIERGNRYVLKNVRRIQSCRRNWTDFWREGCLKDTNFTIWPDGTTISGDFVHVPWDHPIPEEADAAR